MKQLLKDLRWPSLLIVIGLILIVISLTACAPQQGTVSEKDYDEGYSYWQAGTTTCSGTPSRCTTTPGYMVYVPDSYDLLIVNGDDKGWVGVSQRTFDSTEVGDYYDHGTITAGH